MASVEIDIDEEKLYMAVQDAEGTESALNEAVNAITSRANALSSGFRTGRYYDREAHELKGDTQPSYKGDVRRMGKTEVGIVYTANYAAMKDNMEHNTLLKSVR
ncbi:MAG: hypothetical protein IKG22_05530 [Atopobiaceae bacterium]|nr:hypothetical protein [Atopobiaceae bacterium]